MQRSRVQPLQNIAPGIELSEAVLVDPLQQDGVNAAFAEVFGDFRARVVGAEGFLVDVFLEDVSEHVRVDDIVVRALRVIEIPGILAEEPQYVLESDIGDADGAVSLLQLVRDEETAIQVGDSVLAEQGTGFAWALRSRSLAWRNLQRKAPSRNSL